MPQKKKKLYQKATNISHHNISSLPQRKIITMPLRSLLLCLYVCTFGKHIKQMIILLPQYHTQIHTNNLYIPITRTSTQLL